MIKNSVGVWAFGPAVTRFLPPGYHHEVAQEPMVEKTERVAERLSDLLDGLEYHYPGEIDEDNYEVEVAKRRKEANEARASRSEA